MGALATIWRRLTTGTGQKSNGCTPKLQRPRRAGCRERSENRQERPPDIVSHACRYFSRGGTELAPRSPSLRYVCKPQRMFSCAVQPKISDVDDDAQPYVRIILPIPSPAVTETTIIYFLPTGKVMLGWWRHGENTDHGCQATLIPNVRGLGGVTCGFGSNGFPKPKVFSSSRCKLLTKSNASHPAKVIPARTFAM